MVDQDWCDLALTMDGFPYRFCLLAWADWREEQGLPLSDGLRCLAKSHERPEVLCPGRESLWVCEQSAGVYATVPYSLPPERFARLLGGARGSRKFMDPVPCRYYSSPLHAYLAAAAAYEVPIQQEIQT